jgi:hypothetical protein
LPIIIEDYALPAHLSGDNIIAALGHRDRICEITLSGLTDSLFERLATVEQGPFPALTDLHLTSAIGSAPVPLPDTFLGGSAPHLRTLFLCGVPFPAIPKLLRHSHDLVDVQLRSIPDNGYFSPEEMATSLSALTNLKSLHIEFQSPVSRPDPGNTHPTPPTRVVLPALTQLVFRGVSEYFEDLVARIDTPVIGVITVFFFNELRFDIPQFALFIGRTGALGSSKRAKLSFKDRAASVALLHPPEGRNTLAEIVPYIEISCGALDWQISALARICDQFAPFFSRVERLDIGCEMLKSLDWEVAVDRTQWEELFRPFIAVQSLDIARELDGYIVPALQDLTGNRVMAVLPALRSLTFSGYGWDDRSLRKTLQPFKTARHRNNHPVTVQFEDDTMIALSQSPP